MELVVSEIWNTLKALHSYLHSAHIRFFTTVYTKVVLIICSWSKCSITAFLRTHIWAFTCMCANMNFPNIWCRKWSSTARNRTPEWAFSWSHMNDDMHVYQTKLDINNMWKTRQNTIGELLYSAAWVASIPWTETCSMMYIQNFKLHRNKSCIKWKLSSKTCTYYCFGSLNMYELIILRSGNRQYVNKQIKQSHISL